MVTERRKDGEMEVAPDRSPWGHHIIRPHTFSASVPPRISVVASIAEDKSLRSDAQRFLKEAENLSTFPVTVDASAWSAVGTA